MENMTVALAGNPNVGKSTVFNALTGLKQHTGNWAGKTVSTASGSVKTQKRQYTLIDLPGTYSLAAHSEEERIADSYLLSGAADAVIVVCDATCLQRGLHLVLQCIALNPNVILCLNLMDEAARKGIDIHVETLSEKLGVPVIGCTARQKKTLRPLIAALDEIKAKAFIPKPIDDSRTIAAKAEQIYTESVIIKPKKKSAGNSLDHFLINTFPGFLTMVLALALVLWVTIWSANMISDWLSAILTPVGCILEKLLSHSSPWFRSMVTDGIWRVLSWVISVMLPPMAIFFPLFTIMEDAGFLPRVAFALDRPFAVCGACGKQSLTCCMGIGCNAAGVIGCRIIDSSRERMLAVLTNAFMPCSGRFPMLAALCIMFFTPYGKSIYSAGILAAIFICAFLLTFAATKILSLTVLKGETSAFTLELPPFRPPQIGRVFVRSILDRTIFVLGRAAAVAAPAGALIWMLSNIYYHDARVLDIISGWIDPAGRIMGLDGVILLSFLLGLPANEIVLPLILLGYMSTGTLPELGAMDQLRNILLAHGWTMETAISASAFALVHWPCSTTAISIWKETKSAKWTMIGILLPTVAGLLLCILIHILFSL